MPHIQITELLNLLFSSLVGFVLGVLTAWISYRLARKRDDRAWQRQLEQAREERDRAETEKRSQHNAQEQTELRTRLLNQDLVDYAGLLRQTEALIKKLKLPGNPHPKEFKLELNFQDRIDLLEQAAQELLATRGRILQLLVEIYADLAQFETAPEIVETDPSLREHLNTALTLSAHLLNKV